MKTVYRPANGIEAHMLRDLLAQDGIDAHVMGASLEGAIGELPAAGLVRLEVAEEDYAKARALLVAWEQTSPPPEPDAPPAAKERSGVGAGVGGLAIGIVLSALYFRAPLHQQAVDYNRDGVPDETWTTSPSGAAREMRGDRNGDGRHDIVTRFSGSGVVTESESDDDFDGIFETRFTYEAGLVTRSDVDTDRDGLPDVRTFFTHGVPDRATFFDKYSGRPLRIEYYRGGRISHADVDTDRDGMLDRRVTYSRIGEEVASEELTPER